MTGVLCVHEVGEAPPSHEPIVPLCLGGRGGRPVYRSLRDDMGIALLGGKVGEAA